MSDFLFVAQEMLDSWMMSGKIEFSGHVMTIRGDRRSYVLEPAEPGNYDNIDEPARSRLLQLLEQHRVEVLFAGHVHHFIYQKHGITDCYNLFATSFVRQDYSEMFRIAAADEAETDALRSTWYRKAVPNSQRILEEARQRRK